MYRVYVAGAYTANSSMGVLLNMRRGIRIAMRLLKAGFAPFIPWLDYQLVLMQPEENTFTVEDLFNLSMRWLLVSDAVFVVPKSEHSIGVKNEVLVAEVNKIPVFYEIKDLIAWRFRKDEEAKLCTKTR